MGADETLEQVVDELYGLSPKEFTSARNAHAAAARKAGDRQLSDSVRSLARPSTSAWLINRLVRDAPDDLERLHDLRVAIQVAQAESSGAELRKLSGERRAVIGALVGEAAAIGKSSGHAVSRAVEEEVRGALEAAVSNELAFSQVHSGCLTAAISYAGMGDFIAPPEEAVKNRNSDLARLRSEAARAFEEKERDVGLVSNRLVLVKAERAEIVEKLSDVDAEIGHLESEIAAASAELDSLRQRLRSLG